RDAAGEQDRLRANAIDQCAGRSCSGGSCTHHCGKHESCRRGCKAAVLMEVDDLEREDQPVPEEVESVPGLQQQDWSRQVRAPDDAYASPEPAHVLAAQCMHRNIAMKRNIQTTGGLRTTSHRHVGTASYARRRLAHLTTRRSSTLLRSCRRFVRSSIQEGDD